MDDEDDFSRDENVSNVSIDGLSNVRIANRILGFHWSPLGNELIMFPTVNDEKRKLLGAVRNLTASLKELLVMGNPPNQISKSALIANGLLRTLENLVSSYEKHSSQPTKTPHSSRSSIQWESILSVANESKDLTENLIEVTNRILIGVSQRSITTTSDSKRIDSETNAELEELLHSHINVFNQLTKGIDATIKLLEKSLDRNDIEKQTGSVTAHIMSWNVVLPKLRKLFCESEFYFRSIHAVNVSPENTPDIPVLDQQRRFFRQQLELLATSRNYRTLLEEQLHLEDENENIDQISRESSSSVQMLHVAHLVWNLAEIFFLTLPTPSISHLIEWYRKNYGDDIGEIGTGQEDVLSEQFWNLLYKYLIHGQINRASELIQEQLFSLKMGDILPSKNLSFNDQREVLELIQSLLSELPLLGDMDADLDADIEVYPRLLEQWQKKCNVLIRREDIQQNRQLSRVFNIFCGDPDVLDELTSTWYELLIAKLLWEHPYMEEIPQMVAEITSKKYVSLTPLDKILISIIRRESTKVMLQCYYYFEDSWLAVHLTDLLTREKIIPNYRLDGGCDLREWFLLDYVYGVMRGDRSLWTLAPTYLKECKVFGSVYLEELLERQPVETDLKASKLLRLCEQYQLPSNRSTIIQKIVASRKVKQCQYGAAIYWLMRSGATQRAIQLATRLLNEILHTGKSFSMEDIIESLSLEFPFPDKLTMLNQYHQLRLHWEQGNEEEFAHLSLKLLTSRMAPIQLWPTILCDLCVLLDRSPIVFGVEETQQLLHCLEESDLSLSRHLVSNEHNQESQAVRSSLMRHLVRATMESV